MINPWEFPLPLVADSDERALLLALGKALNKWEYMEFGLSQLYSLFVGDRSWYGMREYGANGKIFRDRMDGLARVADQWFARNCNQSIEGEFNRIVIAAKGFSERRNEFAHGLVMDVKGFYFWNDQLRLCSWEQPRFLVIPAMHVVRKHDDKGMPTFGYSSYELSIMHDRIHDLEIEIAHFMNHLWPGWLHEVDKPSAPRKP